MKTGMELLACAERTRPLRPYAYIVYSSGLGSLLTLYLPSPWISHGGSLSRQTCPEAAHTAPKVPW